MPQDEKISIKLLIGKQIHHIIVPLQKEAIFRRAAENINNVLAKYEMAYPNQNAERYFSSAILQFAVSALELEERNNTTPFCESIVALTEEIEATLNNPPKDIV